MLVSPGMPSCARAGSVAPCSGCPRKADRPAPNSASARPVANWLVRKPSVRPPNSNASTAPAAAPATNPSAYEPLKCTAENPSTAATSIMPSMPRLTTPLFSLMRMPSAASSSGVPAFIVVAISAASEVRHGATRAPRRQCSR